MEPLKLILFTFSAAFIAVVPPGLVNIAIGKIALQKDKKNGIFAAFGVCTVNFFHALIAITAAGYLDRNTDIQDYILRIGVGVFAVLTLYFLYAAFFFKELHLSKSLQPKDLRKSYIKGFLVANLNILPILYFAFVSSQLKLYVQDIYSPTNRYLFAFSAMMGTLTILYLYIIVFLRFLKYRNTILKYANVFMAVLMLILFFITFIRI